MDYEWLIRETIARYKEMKSVPGVIDLPMMRYRDMSQGGDGGPLGYWPDDWAEKAVNTRQPVVQPTYRGYNYPGYPDRFFQRVLEGLGGRP